MRQGPHSKRGRGRGGNNNRRSHTPNRNQAFDSNGPDVRIRGNASQVHDKYLALARDATTSGDRILAESYFQHADHYFRVLSQIAEEQEAHRQRQANNQNNGQNAQAAQPGNEQPNSADANADAQQPAGDVTADETPASDEPEVELRGMAKAAKDASEQEAAPTDSGAKQVDLIEMSNADQDNLEQAQAPRRSRAPRRAPSSDDGESPRPRRRTPRPRPEQDASAAE